MKIKKPAFAGEDRQKPEFFVLNEYPCGLGSNYMATASNLLLSSSRAVRESLSSAIRVWI